MVWVHECDARTTLERVARAHGVVDASMVSRLGGGGRWGLARGDVVVIPAAATTGARETRVDARAATAVVADGGVVRWVFFALGLTLGFAAFGGRRSAEGSRRNRRGSARRSF